MMRAWPVIACLALVACGARDDPRAPASASAGEERALSEAAEMIARGRPTATAPSASGSDGPLLPAR